MPGFYFLGWTCEREHYKSQIWIPKNVNCSVSAAKNLKYYKCGEVQVEGPRAQNILINYIQEIMQVEY